MHKQAWNDHDQAASWCKGLQRESDQERKILESVAQDHMSGAKDNHLCPNSQEDLKEELTRHDEIRKVQLFEIEHLTSMQGVLSKVHDQLDQRWGHLVTASVTLKKYLSRLKQQNGSNERHVPRDEDDKIR